MNDKNARKADNKNVRKEEAPWKTIVIVVVCNYALTGILYLFTDTLEEELWLLVLWPIIGFLGYAASMMLSEDRPIPVIIKNPGAMKNMNGSNEQNSNVNKENFSKELENERQKVKDLTVLIESKDTLIAHMQKEIEVYQKQINELIKKI